MKVNNHKIKIIANVLGQDCIGFEDELKGEFTNLK